MEALPPPCSKSKSRPSRKRSLEPLLGESPCDPRMVEATVEVHQQNISPKPSEQNQRLSPQKSPSRQNDSFKVKNRYSADIETIPCILCGQVDHCSENYTCKGREFRKSSHDDDEDSDFSSIRVKSRSMPTMCNVSLNSSQTVYQMCESQLSDEIEISGIRVESRLGRP